jgi:serine/threonine-protein kinase
VRAWEARIAPFARSFIWIHGYAATVTTPEEAAEALAALPRFLPQPPYRPMTMADGVVGRTYLLAGRTDEALPLLERATRSCRALELPLEHTRAFLSLGAAREAKGDAAGACAAYALVLARWEKASPRSITAQKARERARVLGCAGAGG